MAYDLWNPSFPEEESYSYIQPEWQYDFYFGYGYDVIEENALNEKSCIQVLRILITKADTEIDELEKDLVMLQSELAWAEHEEWSDICCSALIEKINCLDISIRKLKNKDDNDIEVYLLMHTEPAQDLHEIVKALLRSICDKESEQNEQSQGLLVTDTTGSMERSSALHEYQKTSTSDSSFAAKEENNGPAVALREDIISSNPSKELEVKKENSSETDPATLFVNIPDQDAFKHSASNLNKTKKMNCSEEATVHTSISAADMLILDSSSNPMGMRADLTKKVKGEQPANIMAKDLGSTARKETTGNSNGIEKMCDRNMKIDGCELPACYTTTIGMGIISNSCSNLEHKGNILIANKAESLQCDMEQKLCDFAVKSARKRGIKEIKIASTDKKGPAKSLFKREGKRKDSLPVAVQKEAVLSDNEHSALISLVALQDERGKDRTIQLMEGKQQPEEVQIAEIASSDEKLVMNLHMRTQSGKVKTVKKKLESTSATFEEPGLDSVNISNSSATWRKANNHLSGKVLKKTVQHGQCEDEVRSMVLDASQNTMSMPEKKYKRFSSIPIVVEIRGSAVQMNISKLHADANRSKTEFAKPDACVDSCAKGVAPQPLDVSNLTKMKMRDLKSIAKARKLTKYSALKKEDLVRLLEKQLSW